jgi:hypothetical protein
MSGVSNIMKPYVPSSDEFSINKFYLNSVWPDGRVPRIEAYDRIGARGNNEVHQEVDPLAAISHARRKFRARRPGVLGKGDAKNS